MSEFLFYNRYTAGIKDICRYCGKHPEFINTNPGFHYGYTACYNCVKDGPCTPHFRTLMTYDIGNMTYHIGHGAHDKAILPRCRWCRADTNPNSTKRKFNPIDADYNPNKRFRKPIAVIKFPETPMPYRVNEFQELVFDFSNV